MMSLAKALYNNTAESPEELTFSQGDILNIIQKDVNGLSGWWLCSFNGKMGIAPGNRLRILDSEKTRNPSGHKSLPAGTQLRASTGRMSPGGSMRLAQKSQPVETKINGKPSWHQPDKVRTYDSGLELVSKLVFFLSST